MLNVSAAADQTNSHLDKFLFMWYNILVGSLCKIPLRTEEKRLAARQPVYFNVRIPRAPLASVNGGSTPPTGELAYPGHMSLNYNYSTAAAKCQILRNYSEVYLKQMVLFWHFADF